MNLVRFALRRPITILVLVAATALGSGLALRRMPVDVFPSLHLPVIYVAQPYGGMDPAQMEGLLTNYYEYHFLYIAGIHHVESKNIQGLALMKLFFHPGADMAQAMAETISYVNRSRAFMPPGTVSPFVMRFDTGSVPVGYLVLSSDTRTLGEIQDLALFRVRPMFASLPGVSAPPPFGGSQRTIVVRADPDRLRACGFSPGELVSALNSGNAITPSGNARLGDRYPIVPVNSVVKDIQDLGAIPIRTGTHPTVYVRDVASIADAMDLPTGYALADGRRAIYLVVTKRADASTLSVVNEVKAAIPRMQAVLPEDIQVRFEFDQSPHVTRAIRGLGLEGLLGAVLTGLMVLLFLRDWRSAVVVVLNIPLALMAAVFALWLSGQTLNLMTLGGLALAVGILVDEATVAIENIHARRRGASLSRAVLEGSIETAVPRFLSMLCILAVFLPSFFLKGAVRELFLPLSLAVGFSMLASYLLSSSFVPVLSGWILPGERREAEASEQTGWFARGRDRYRRALERVVGAGGLVTSLYLLAAAATVALGVWLLGIEIFPRVDSNQFRLRLRAPDGTHFERTEAIALDTLKLIGEEVGPGNVRTTLGYAGAIPSSYPINAIYHWSGGPHEATLWVALKEGSGLRVPELQERLRTELSRRLPEVKFSFEPADIVSEVMSFGSPTPVEVAVSGLSLTESRRYLETVREKLAGIPSLRDLEYGQSLDYPTVEVNVDREKAGQSGVTIAEVARSLIAATSSSRFVLPNFWPDPKTGIGYQVQVEIPQSLTRSLDDLETVPVEQIGYETLLVRDVSRVSPGAMPGQFDRYNMRRELSLTANIAGEDLGRVARRIRQAIAAAGEPPRGATVTVRGQIPPLSDMLDGLAVGLGLAVVVIFLLLAANFQSLRLSLITVSAVPAVAAGVVVALFVTRTSLNLQSFIGAIMAVGVAMANGILLVTFAERRRREGLAAPAAAIEGALGRLRPILMTSCAMMAGMLPMVLALGEGGEQSAPLGRAVFGGLAFGTLATLVVLPCVFSLVQARAGRSSHSLDPDDPLSDRFEPRSVPAGPGGPA